MQASTNDRFQEWKGGGKLHADIQLEQGEGAWAGVLGTHGHTRGESFEEDVWGRAWKHQAPPGLFSLPSLGLEPGSEEEIC